MKKTVVSCFLYKVLKTRKNGKYGIFVFVSEIKGDMDLEKLRGKMDIQQHSGSSA